jgi:hypothetical protein
MALFQETNLLGFPVAYRGTTGYGAFITLQDVHRAQNLRRISTPRDMTVADLAIEASDNSVFP